MATAGAPLAEDRAVSQTVRAELMLRDLILAGEIRPGERLAELAIVERIGVSRTPVRAALMKLAEEGLLEAIPSGGYAARAFGEREVLDAIELRGTLEGLAARLAAERGASSTALDRLRDLLARLDEAVARIAASEDAFTLYIDLNAAFHREITRLAASRVVERQIERAMSLPFASPSAFVRAQSESPEAGRILILAQDQHHCIVDAITRREGARAEALMREHSRLAGRNLAMALRSRAALARVPGAALIQIRTE
ncbi:GntR family transcriptional regulator [Rhabdaerophilum calidifontis]|uniref:GntR family transcriptional regulator n=1 Tax=Rhabdaerophilum calidifontis TaxID=2604328 RepID=UPI003CCC597E